MKIRLLLMLVFISVFIIGCESQHKQVDQNTGIYAPVVNPKPKYFITIKGKMDPRLKRKIKLEWVATYYTTNDKCREVVNSIEGIDAARQKLYTYKINPDKKGDFQQIIPLDKISTGYCRWKLFGLHLRQSNIKPPMYLIFIDFQTKKTNLSSLSINYKCDDTYCYYAKNHRLVPTYDANTNYLHKININLNYLNGNHDE